MKLVQPLVLNSASCGFFSLPAGLAVKRNLYSRQLWRKWINEEHGQRQKYPNQTPLHPHTRTLTLHSKELAKPDYSLAQFGLAKTTNRRVTRNLTLDVQTLLVTVLREKQWERSTHQCHKLQLLSFHTCVPPEGKQEQEAKAGCPGPQARGSCHAGESCCWQDLGGASELPPKKPLKGKLFNEELKEKEELGGARLLTCKTSR